MSMYDETTNETFKRGLARKAIIEVAQSMLDGSFELLAGCRKLVRLRIEAAAPVSPAFNAITGVESETDDYPFGRGRNAYSAELLAKLVFGGFNIGKSIPTPVGTPGTSTFAWRASANLGRIAGRYLPYVGTVVGAAATYSCLGSN